MVIVYVGYYIHGNIDFLLHDNIIILCLPEGGVVVSSVGGSGSTIGWDWIMIFPIQFYI